MSKRLPRFDDSRPVHKEVPTGNCDVISGMTPLTQVKHKNTSLMVRVSVFSLPFSIRCRTYYSVSRQALLVLLSVFSSSAKCLLPKLVALRCSHLSPPHMLLSYEDRYCMRTCWLQACQNPAQRQTNSSLSTRQPFCRRNFDKLLTVYITKCNGQKSAYIYEKVFSVASAVTCVSGELKSAGNVLTGGQRVC
jgi:hypothetical protein